MRTSLLMVWLMLPGVATAQLLVPEEKDSVRAEAIEYGLPLPPTEAEIEALSPELFLAQSSAIKRVVLLQQLQFVADGYRMTDGNRLATAFLAIKLKAPEAFNRILAIMAANELSTRQHRALNRVYDRYLEAYKVDMLAIRLFVESDLAAPELISDMSATIPYESIFNLVDPNKLTVSRCSEDLQEMTVLYSEITHLYSGITNAEQAAAAETRLYELVRRFAKVYPNLALAPQDLRDRLSAAYAFKLQPLIPALREQRRRLHDENFYGNARLKVLDYFIN